MPLKCSFGLFPITPDSSTQPDPCLYFKAAHALTPSSSLWSASVLSFRRRSWFNYWAKRREREEKGFGRTIESKGESEIGSYRRQVGEARSATASCINQRYVRGLTKPGARFNCIKKHHENHHEKTSHQKVTIKKSNWTFVMIFVMCFSLLNLGPGSQAVI